MINYKFLCCMILPLSLGAVFASGCSENDEPLPPVSVEAAVGGPVLVNLESLPEKSSLIVPLTEEPQEASAAVGGSGVGDAEGGVIVDTSSPDATAASIISMMSHGDFSRVSELVIDPTPEFFEQAQNMDEALGPIIRAGNRFLAAWGQAFPETPFEAPRTGGLPMLGGMGKSLSIGDIQMGGAGDSATVTMVGGNGNTIEEFPLRQVNGSWLVEDPSILLDDEFMPTDPTIQAQIIGLMNEIATALDEITTEIEGGMLETSDAAYNAMQTRIAPTFLRVMEIVISQPGGNENAPEIDLSAPEIDLSPPGGSSSAAPGSDRTQPRERDPSSPVDSTFSGPGMLRGR